VLAACGPVLVAVWPAPCVIVKTLSVTAGPAAMGSKTLTLIVTA
jgi:hypothetical protein